MKKFNFRKQLMTAAVGGALALGGASQVFASPYFQYDLLGGSGGSGSIVTANALAGVSSENLLAGAGNTFTGSGWVQFTALTDAGPAVPNTSYNDTGLYLLFNIGVTWLNVPGFGGFGQPNSFYSVTAFTFSVYQDDGFDNTFTQADASSLTAATVSGVVGDTLLGTGALVTPGNASIANNNGTTLNVTTSFDLNADGAKYFFDPNPFYDLALAGFSSTGGAWALNGPFASVSNATGAVDFERIPEPGSLALLGLALSGMVGVSRRRNRSV